MTKRIPNYGSVPESVRRRLEPIAAQHGVSVDRIVYVVRGRRQFRRADFYRKRSRRRALAKNPNAFKRAPRIGNVYSGEGDLHVMMRAVDLTPDDFERLTGIHRTVFYRWYGHPVHPWPLEFLRWYGYAKAMERYLADYGIDCEQFKPKLATLLARQGRYPRKAGQEPAVAPTTRDGDWSPWKP